MFEFRKKVEHMYLTNKEVEKQQKVIACGAFGDVFRGSIKREVVLKRLCIPLADDNVDNVLVSFLSRSLIYGTITYELGIS